MIRLEDVALRRGTRLLFEQVTLTFHDGEKIGLVGANGAGKSSLFALIRAELHADAGSVEIPPNLVIAHVAQEMPADQRAAIEHVIDGDRELRRIEAELVGLDPERDGLAVAHLHERLDTIGGYQARARAARLMRGLGFRAEDEDTPVARFSGGWRMRINLAQALMCRSDVLLLDEPTNHLDLDALLWLQDWLGEYAGTLLLISHDRDFLDAVVRRIVHLEAGSALSYAGNYSDFEVRRAERLAQQNAAYARQQRDIARIRSFVDRFRAQATKARQAQSRLKALARMEAIAPAHADSPFDFAFAEPAKLPRPLLRVKDAAFGYSGVANVRVTEMSIAPGDRIGLLGANGAGKSTLIKTLAGELPLVEGQRHDAKDLKIGYFAQHQLEQLRPDESPLQHLQRLDPQALEKQLRDFLGGFDFRGDNVFAPVGPLSGGEKVRLALALIVYQQPNLLLLDEPTNHLDLEMRYALCNALQEFAGAVIVVSHDRYLLRTVTETFWRAADGRVEPFDGDLDDYRRLLQTSQESTVPAATGTTESVTRKDQRRLDAARRQQLRPLQQALSKAETELERLTTEQAALEARLAEPSVYEAENKSLLLELLASKADLEKHLADAEMAWLEAGEALEAAQAASEAA